MANIIQIKRSTTNATIPSLANGELAYSQNTGVLAIGLPDGGGNMAIGGNRAPGVLTANQAMVTNSTSAMDKIIVANLQPTYVFANGAAGSALQALLSNSTGGVYWGTTGSGAPGGSNTQLEFNDSGSFGGTAGLNYDKTTNNFTVANTILLGNTTVNTTINSTAHLFANSTVSTTYGLTIAVGANVIIDTAKAAFGNSTVNSTVNSTIIAMNGSTLANSTGAINAFNLISVAGANFVQNTDSRTLSGNLTFTGANAVFSGTNTSVSSNVTITGANVDATSALLRVQNLIVSGNITVSGTVSSIDTAQLIVNDNLIEMGDGNITTDTVDTGFFSPAGNSTVIWYSGLARIAANSSNNKPYFWLFGSNTNPNTASTIDTSTNTVTGYLQSYLLPYGAAGAFVANATVINITANSTLSSAIVANSLTLSTALGAGSGGTGQEGGYTAGDILYASGASTLSKLIIPVSAANGQVLQITNNLPAYGVLDGGTF